jgi:tetratricopeptide (TPR) repeat protein
MMPAGYAGDVTDDPLGVALGLLRADAPAEIAREPGSWPRWAVLLPHVLAATSHLDQEQSPAAGLLQDASWLLDRAGTYLQAHARLNDALPLRQRALAITEATHGPDHPDVATNLTNLALTLHNLGQYEQARPLAERAQAITRGMEMPDDGGEPEENPWAG